MSELEIFSKALERINQRFETKDCKSDVKEIRAFKFSNDDIIIKFKNGELIDISVD